MTVKILGFTTKAYRIALAVVGVAGMVLPQIKEGVDLTDPTFWMGVVMLVIVAIRQVSDGTTPTLPTTPVQPPAGPGAGG